MRRLKGLLRERTSEALFLPPKLCNNPHMLIYNKVPKNGTNNLESISNLSARLQGGRKSANARRASQGISSAAN
jgi:hypothetical protein